MATRNSDGTVVVKTTGAIFRKKSGTATRGSAPLTSVNGGGLVYAGTNGYRKPGWRIVTKTER